VVVLWELVEVGSLVLNRAEELDQENVSIKTLDAIHVASLVTLLEGESLLSRVNERRPTHLGLDVIWWVRRRRTLLSSTSAFI
jgi:hypothetical protein